MGQCHRDDRPEALHGMAACLRHLSAEAAALGAPAVADLLQAAAAAAREAARRGATDTWPAGTIN